ncbi:MAG: cytochrome c-type biogenesis protein CcmH [Burkholderiaceae bacterium]|nr:cytochrome c-type biogenesis protein CcmH [Burkholderiaceae bacterium]
MSGYPQVPREQLVERRTAQPRSARRSVVVDTLLALTVAIVALAAQLNSASAQSAPTAATAPADAAKPAAVLPPDEVTRRVKSLEKELRCLVCQNQTLADSNADLAKDLRDQVLGQVSQGKSDDEVKAYLVARYGDFVLYRPPFKVITLGLWVGPFALLIVGGVIFLMVQRRQRIRARAGSETARGADDTTAGPSAEAHERARKLLD